MGNIILGGANGGFYKYLYISILPLVIKLDNSPTPKLINKLIIKLFFIFSPNKFYSKTFETFIPLLRS